MGKLPGALFLGCLHPAGAQKNNLISSTVNDIIFSNII